VITKILILSYVVIGIMSIATLVSLRRCRTGGRRLHEGKRKQEKLSRWFCVHRSISVAEPSLVHLVLTLTTTHISGPQISAVRGPSGYFSPRKELWLQWVVCEGYLCLIILPFFFLKRVLILSKARRFPATFYGFPRRKENFLVS